MHCDAPCRKPNVRNRDRTRIVCFSRSVGSECDIFSGENQGARAWLSYVSPFFYTFGKRVSLLYESLLACCLSMHKVHRTLTTPRSTRWHFKLGSLIYLIKTKRGLPTIKVRRLGGRGIADTKCQARDVLTFNLQQPGCRN